MAITVSAYENEKMKMKKACVDYIKAKGPSITMASHFWAIKTSHPVVWKSLRKDLGVPDSVVYKTSQLAVKRM